MFEGKKGFEDIAEFVKALKEYLSLKNKTLWESADYWKSGSKTIKGISKYQTVQVDLNLGGSSMLLNRRGKYLIGGNAIGYPAWFATTQFTIELVGDVAYAVDSLWLAHNQNSNHEKVNTTLGISRIVGVEPVIPESLRNYLGGGY